MAGTESSRDPHTANTDLCEGQRAQQGSLVSLEFRGAQKWKTW